MDMTLRSNVSPNTILAVHNILVFFGAMLVLLFGFLFIFLVPPAAYFLGCIFWSSEEFEELPGAGWKEAVIKYGGKIVKDYTSIVTHVVAEHSRFPEYLQVLREGKRIVSNFWLNDVIERQIMVPPYQAFHLPALFPRYGKSI